MIQHQFSFVGVGSYQPREQINWLLCGMRRSFHAVELEHRRGKSPSVLAFSDVFLVFPVICLRVYGALCVPPFVWRAVPILNIVGWLFFIKYANIFVRFHWFSLRVQEITELIFLPHETIPKQFWVAHDQLRRKWLTPK